MSEEVEIQEDTLTADLAAAWDASESDDGDQSEGSEVSQSYSEPSNTQGGGDWDGDNEAEGGNP